MNRLLTSLHTHTEYSILDAIGSVEKRLKAAKDHGLTSIAITEHGNTNSVYQLYDKSKTIGIKPIFGIEAYFCNDRNQKQARENNHLTILAKNQEGLNNLLLISNLGFIEGYYYVPRIDWDLLEKHGDGLIILSGCPGGKIPKAIERGDKKELNTMLDFFTRRFGEDFYLEFSINDMVETRDILKGLKEISESRKIPMVITEDIHYNYKKEAELHDYLKMMQQRKTISQKESSFVFSCKTLYFKNEDEFEDIRKRVFDDIISKDDILRMFDTSNSIPEKVSSIELDKSLKIKGIIDRDVKEELKAIIRKNLEKITDPQEKKDTIKRLKYEMEVLEKCGFLDYMYIVQDYVNWAKNNDIFVGAGRGSVSCSMVAYMLGITKVNPMKFGLIFERFLAYDSPKFPDIDCDFQSAKRDQVIKYIFDKYGDENTCFVGTYGMMKTKSLIKDVSRVFEVPFEEVNKVTKSLPMFNPMDSQEYEELDEEGREEHITPELSCYYEKYPEIKKVVNGIGTQIRHLSQHAAGIIISNKKLKECIPLAMRDKKLFTGLVESQMRKELSALGFVKFDILGLSSLDILEQCCKLSGVNLDDIPFDDEKCFKFFEEGKTEGVFQFSGEGMKSILSKVKPKRFYDIVIANSLYRPGPINSGMIEIYANTTQEDIPSAIQEYLKDTKGLVIFQEQIMQILMKLGKFTPGEADYFRRFLEKMDRKAEIKKQDQEKFDKLKDKLFENSKEFITASQASDIYEKLVKFGGYTFNAAHAVAYSMISYYLMWFKVNKPLEYVVANLNFASNDMEHVDNSAQYMRIAASMGVKILGVDINESGSGYSIKDGAILCGLNNLKNVGPTAIKEIFSNRPYSSVEDFISKVKKRTVNKRVLESLIIAGGFSKWGTIREVWKKVFNKEFDGDIRQKKIEVMGYVPFPTKVRDFLISKGFYKLSTLDNCQDSTVIKSFGQITNIKKIVKGKRIIVFVDIDDGERVISLFSKVDMKELKAGDIVLSMIVSNERNGRMAFSLEGIQNIKETSYYKPSC